jgi:hypothetical protein
MFNNSNSDLNKKTSLPVNYRCVGSMDHPVRWDEKMAAVYHMENSHTERIMLIISYAVKKCLKLDILHMLRHLPASWR